MYAYAGNNPVRYIDPDGNDIISITSFYLQNSSEHKTLPMGASPSGIFDSNGNLLKQNTIGDYGCLFISIMNTGNSLKRNHFTDLGIPSDINFNCSPNEYNASDSYFHYSQNPRNQYETDANMLFDNICNLLKDVSKTSDFSIEFVIGDDIQKRINAISSNPKENAYVIGRCEGHYFNINNYSYRYGFRIHDVFGRSSFDKAKAFLDKINNGKMDGIIIIKPKCD